MEVLKFIVCFVLMLDNEVQFLFCRSNKLIIILNKRVKNLNELKNDVLCKLICMNELIDCVNY